MANLILIILSILFIIALFWCLYHITNWIIEDKKTQKNVNHLIEAAMHMAKYTKKTHKLLGDFYESNYTIRTSNGIVGGYFFADERIEGSKKIKVDCPIDYNLIVKNRDFAFRRNLVKLLFRIAAEGDGIKNDEWQFILNAMKQLKMNKKNYEYWMRYYAPLRSEEDDYSQYYSNESKKTYSSATPTTYLNHYYSILGLKENATKREIQERYHHLALEFHPDLPQNEDMKDECELKMATINDAYARIISKL